MENCIKLRINAGDKNASNAQDKAIADAYGNKFIIPLDFEMLDSAAPYYQAGLRNRLCYEITFNDYNRVTKSVVSSPKVPDAKHKITDISLEYEIVTRDPSKFYNPKIQKVSVIVEGKPNQLYTQGMRSFEQYEEICKYFLKKSRETMMLMKFKRICNFTI